LRNSRGVLASWLERGATGRRRVGAARAADRVEPRARLGVVAGPLVSATARYHDHVARERAIADWRLPASNAQIATVRNHSRNNRDTPLIEQNLESCRDTGLAEQVSSRFAAA
jgi:hypothetical protein